VTKPNKDYWKDGQVTGYERKQRLLVPGKDELLDVVVDSITLDEAQGPYIVDVGAGQGHLSERILRRFENVRVVLLDSSEEMLSVARKRLAEFGSRASFEVGDFNHAQWHNCIETPVDVVVSSIALHYLEDERRFPFFESVFHVLKKAGCFINGDAFNMADPSDQMRCERVMLEYTQQRLAQDEGKKVSIDELREQRERQSVKAGVNRISLSEQVDILRQVGFPNVEVVWRHLLMAVVAAGKRGTFT